MKKRMKIRWQMIIAITIVSFLTVTISVFTVYHISKNTLQEHYIKMAEDKLSAFSLLVDKQLENQVSVIRKYMLDEMLINEISEEPTTDNGYYFDSSIRRRITSHVSEMFNQMKHPEGIFLFDDFDRYYMYLRSGKNTSPYLDYYKTGLDKDVEWYRRVQESKGKEIFWNEDVLNPKNTQCFSIIKKLNDTSEYKPHGVMIVTVEKKFLETLYSELNTRNIVMLLDAQENLVIQIGKQSADEVETFFESYKNRELGKEKSAYLYLEQEDKMTGWKFITGIRKNELYEEEKYLQPYIVILLIIVIMAVMIVSVLVVSSINRPLEKLKGAVEEINSGKRQIETEFDSDEIGDIGNTIKRVINNNLFLEKKIVDIELSRKKAQYLLLQAQINPHYLYNTLDSIYILALKYKVDDIGQMVLALSEMFRASLNDGKGYVHISEELAYIENYMTIMNYRFNYRFGIVYDVDDEILDLYMPKLVLQPFVENAIIHGLEPKTGNGTVIISGCQTGEELEFRIYDDGVGFDAREKMMSGYGIRNVVERIQLIFGEEYGVSVESTIGEGTTIEIRIPVKNLEFYQRNET